MGRSSDRDPPLTGAGSFSAAPAIWRRPIEDADEGLFERSIYDPDPDREPDDLGVLFGALARSAAGGRTEPGPVRDGGAAALPGALSALIRLDERMQWQGDRDATLRRIALDEVAALAWSLGWPSAREDLSLIELGQIGVDGAIAQWARWAYRELAHLARDRIEAATPEALFQRVRASGLLARLSERRSEAGEQRIGEEHAAFGRSLLGEWLERFWEGRGLDPVQASALGFEAWLRLFGRGPRAMATGAIFAMRFGAGGGLQALTFVPLAIGGRRHRLFERVGDPEVLRSSWMEAIRTSSESHALTLTSLADWRARALEAVRGRVGRAVVEALAAVPLATTGALAHRSRATPQRVNAIAEALEQSGLVREVTGRSRYRVWAANPSVPPGAVRRPIAGPARPSR